MPVNDRMRVVLDTNVLISALLFGGELRYITKLLQHGDITPCFSLQTWNELEHVFHYSKFAPVLERVHVQPEEILTRLEFDSVFVADSISPLRVREDPADEAILACAIKASARAVVTGDRLLLHCAPRFIIPILSPMEFKKSYKHLRI